MRKTLTIAIASLFVITLVPQPASAVRVCNTDDPNPDDLFELCVDVGTQWENVNVVKRNEEPDAETICVPFTDVCVDVPHLGDLIEPDIQPVLVAKVNELHFDPKGRENINKVCRVVFEEDCLPEERSAPPTLPGPGFGLADADGDGGFDGLVIFVGPNALYLPFSE